MEKLHKGLAGQGYRNRVNFSLQRYYQSTESNYEDLQLWGWMRVACLHIIYQLRPLLYEHLLQVMAAQASMPRTSCKKVEKVFTRAPNHASYLAQ
jgi:hypothetical protein